MKNRDLHNIIKDMAVRLDLHQPDDDSHRPGFLSEVEAYMAVDSTLASLHKEFIDARRNRLRALEQQGKGSAMADIAGDLEESAKSAMETRMIELRGDQVKRAMAEQMLARAHIQELDEERESAIKETARRAAEFYARNRRDQAIAIRHQQESEDSFMMLWLMWWFMRQLSWRAQKRLSLANSFSMAIKQAYESDRSHAAAAA